jgi:hypothetical protein
MNITCAWCGCESTEEGFQILAGRCHKFVDREKYVAIRAKAQHTINAKRAAGALYTSAAEQEQMIESLAQKELSDEIGRAA